jgi:CoA-transferase family III
VFTVFPPTLADFHANLTNDLVLRRIRSAGVTQPRSRPFDGLRVLDLSRAVSGPFAGRILADLGADVVKVELPGTDLAQALARRLPR